MNRASVCRSAYVQRALWDELWFWNLILKGRQHGISTFICLLMLDSCLFTSNTHCGPIDATLADATKKLDKVRFAYEHLPSEIKAFVPIRADRQQPLATARQRASSGCGQEPRHSLLRGAAHSQQAGFHRGRAQLSQHVLDRRGALRAGYQVPRQLLQGMGREARHLQITARTQLGQPWQRCPANRSLRLRSRLYPAAK